TIRSLACPSRHAGTLTFSRSGTWIRRSRKTAQSWKRSPRFSRMSRSSLLSTRPTRTTTTSRC
ncbi:hypothetical protein BGZ88_007477, partial [Linnemannia elongata]